MWSPVNGSPNLCHRTALFGPLRSATLSRAFGPTPPFNTSGAFAVLTITSTILLISTYCPFAHFCPISCTSILRLKPHFKRFQRGSVPTFSGPAAPFSPIEINSSFNFHGFYYLIFISLFEIILTICLLLLPTLHFD